MSGKIGKITPEHIQQIIDENDLKEVARDYGVIFDATNKARCPFHNDGKNGNLHLYDKKGEEQTYYCFSRKCQAGTKWLDKEKTKRNILTLPDGQQIESAGSNVIGFVMNIERCTFPEACLILMERAGIDPPKAHYNPKEQKAKERTHKLNIKYFRHLKEAPKVIAYLESRGINWASIKKWRLGYIPPSDKSNPCFKEKVAGRLVFGLKEEAFDPKKAKTIAMAYRTLKDEKPKYYNDYTSDLYEKKYYLYGLTEARKPIRAAGYAIVMEGYTDVILSHQSGIENTVATCGTAFTIEQMEKLRKLTRNLVFWYDGDGAGYEAMMESMEDLFEMGFRVKIINSSGYDPADVMNELNQDPVAIRKFIADNAMPALEVIAQDALNKYDAKVGQVQTEVLDELLPILDSIKNNSERVVFRSRIAKRLGVHI